MRRTFGIDVLACPKCESTMKVMEVISQPEVVENGLVHVKLAIAADVLANGRTPALDVSDQTIPDWVVGTNPQDGTGLEEQPQGYERGPNCAVDVLSSASRWRKHVVPNSDAKTQQPPCTSREHQGPAPVRTPTDVKATLAGAPTTKPSQIEPGTAVHRGCIGAATNYVDWATLLRRVYDLDALACTRCGGSLRMIAVITHQPVITKILDAVGLPSRPAVPQARRPHPQLSFDPVLSVP